MRDDLQPKLNASWSDIEMTGRPPTDDFWKFGLSIPSPLSGEQSDPAVSPNTSGSAVIPFVIDPPDSWKFDEPLVKRLHQLATALDDPPELLAWSALASFGRVVLDSITNRDNYEFKHEDEVVCRAFCQLAVELVAELTVRSGILKLKHRMHGAPELPFDRFCRELLKSLSTSLDASKFTKAWAGKLVFLNALPDWLDGFLESTVKEQYEFELPSSGQKSKQPKFKARVAAFHSAWRRLSPRGPKVDFLAVLRPLARVMSASTLGIWDCRPFRYRSDFAEWLEQRRKFFLGKFDGDDRHRIYEPLRDLISRRRSGAPDSFADRCHELVDLLRIAEMALDCIVGRTPGDVLGSIPDTPAAALQRLAEIRAEASTSQVVPAMEVEKWPPDDGWHHRGREFAVCGRKFSLPHAQAELLRCLIERTADEERTKLVLRQELADGSDEALRKRKSELEKSLLVEFGLDKTIHIVESKGKKDEAVWTLISPPKLRESLDEQQPS